MSGLKYIYLSTALKYNFEELIVLKHFHFMLLYTDISEGNIELFSVFFRQLLLLYRLRVYI